MDIRRITLFFALMSLAATAHADHWEGGHRIEGEGLVKEERRHLTSIEAVEFGTTGTLFVEQADSTSLYIRAEENLLPYFETEVRGGMLTIETRKNVNLDPSEPIEFHLTVPDLEELILSSSGDLVLSDWKADRMRVELESSGDLDAGALVCPVLEVRLESSGDLTLESWQGETLHARLGSSGDFKILGGQARELDLDLQSSGDFNASNVLFKEAFVSTSSSGDAVLHVTEYLSAHSSSSGDVVYYGDPEVDARATSSGDVVHRRR